MSRKRFIASITGSKRSLIERAAEYAGTSVRIIRGGRTSKAVARQRHIAMWYAKTRSNESLVSLGEMFNRDHTTVMHGVKMGAVYLGMVPFKSRRAKA